LGAKRHDQTLDETDMRRVSGRPFTLYAATRREALSLQAADSK
jgi:hypothetical protein